MHLSVTAESDEIVFLRKERCKRAAASTGCADVQIRAFEQEQRRRSKIVEMLVTGPFLR